MTTKNYKWLSHLENSIPSSVGGYTTSLYSIALEGWRRGLDLKFIRSNRNKSNSVFELSDGNKTHRFVASRGDLITRDAMKICRNKAEAKKYLLKENVPTPKGNDFPEEASNQEIVNYANELGYPLVVKPIDGTGGKGVIAGIANEKEIEEALKYVREHLGYKSVIVEEYFEGEDYRVYVIGEEVVAITKRIQANVIGDGVSSIRKLIKQKNEERKKSPILHSSLIKIDKELKSLLERQNYNLDSIPSLNERVLLKTKNNISAGGDPVDITDEVSDEIKNIAVEARKAIPGLPHGAIDLMVNREQNTAVAIEINTQASIRTHLFPMEGTARDVPSKLIDYYFPNTKRNHDIPLYFDFGPIWDEFQRGRAKEYIIPDIPHGNIGITRFIVSGRVKRVGYAAWIRRQARDLNLHGYAKHMRNNTIVIVVCGSEENIDQFRTIIETKSSKRAKLPNVVEKERVSPVAIGFEIKNARSDLLVKDGYHPVRLKDQSRTNRKTTSRRSRTSKSKEITKVKKKKENKQQIDYKQEYNKMINSTSWKVTKPIRIIGRLIKNRR